MYPLLYHLKPSIKLHWYPKFYNHVILFVGSKTLGIFLLNFDSLVPNLFKKILIRWVFVYYYGGCISIYRPLSYPLRILTISKQLTYLEYPVDFFIRLFYFYTNILICLHKQIILYSLIFYNLFHCIL